jgi:hypothetical protein
MLEENVVRSAGTDCMMTIDDIERSIVEAGFAPDAAQHVLPDHRGPRGRRAQPEAVRC